MLLIQEILVSDSLVSEYFMCQLDQCKGACCWEGDFGAPLEGNERDQIEQIYDDIQGYLSTSSRKKIEQEGMFAYYEEPKFWGTKLMDDGACVFMINDDLGISKCSFELAYRAGKTDFPKPISCQLYPVRVSSDEALNFEALNYDQWEICNPACLAGKEYKMPLYRFVKAGIIRKYGIDFYEELDAAASQISQ